MNKSSRRFAALLLTLIMLVSNISVTAWGEEEVQAVEPAHVHTSDETAQFVLNAVDPSAAEEAAADQAAPADAEEPKAEAPAAEPEAAKEAPAPVEEPTEAVTEPAPVAEEPKAEEPKAEEPKAEEPQAEEPKAEVVEEAPAAEPVKEEPAAEEAPAIEAPAAEETVEEAPEAEEAEEEEIADEAPDAEEAEEEEIADETPDAEEAEEEEIADETPDAEEAEEEEIADEAPEAEEAEEEEIADEAPDAEEAEEEEIVDEAPDAEEAVEEETDPEAGLIAEDPAAASQEECTHEYDSYSSTNYEYTYLYESVRYHRCYEVLVTTYYCSNCGAEVNQTREDTNNWEDWHSWDANNVCTDCGTPNECTHPSTYDSWDWVDWSKVKFVQVDLRSHNEIGDTLHYTYCETCGKRFDETLVENEVHENCSHDWDENNVCSRCGAKNDCTHEETSESYAWLGDSTYVEIDSRYHTRSGPAMVYTYCELCGKTLGEREESDYTKGFYSHEWNENNECIQCGAINECTHEWVYESFNYDWSTVTYTPIDTIHHKTVGKAEVYQYCDNCGARLNTHIEENYEVTWDHNWNDDDKCVDCDYVNDCDHEQTYESISWLEPENNTYTKINDRYHAETGPARVYTYCASCLKQLSVREESNYVSDYRSRHEWGENGVCTVCGGVNECTHPETFKNSEYIDWSSLVFTPVDARQHKVVGTARVFRECDTCGAKLDVQTVENYEQLWDHTWDSNDVCEDCHYVNTCTHEDTEEYSRWEDWSKVTYTKVDNRYHSLTGPAEVDTYCRTCGKYLDTREESNYTDPDLRRHDWDDNGVCTLCGGVNDCEHKNTGYYTSWDWAHVTYTDIGDLSVHLITGTRYYGFYCNDCGLETIIETEENATDEYGHDWTEDGVCESCGAVNTCSHEGAYDDSYIVWDDTANYKPIDISKHERTGLVRHFKHCPTCHIQLNVTEGRETTTESHEWSDGKCTECGMVNDCKHGETESDWWWTSTDSVEYVNLNTHRRIGTIFTYTYCKTCGLRLSETTEKHEGVTSHNWVDGVCTECHAENSCEHPNKYKNSWMQRVDSYEIIDDRMHKETGTVVENMYCPDCGMEFDRTYRKATELQEHYFENGVCPCGYENTCDHPAKLTSWWWWNEASFTYVDEKQHEVIGIAWIYTYCPKCGESFEGHKEEMTIIQPHYWINGTCNDCGAVNPCQHPAEALLEDKGYFNDWNSVTYSYRDEGWHNVTGEITYTIECTLCGEIVSRRSDIGTQRSQHTWNAQGVCYYCGAINHCDHKDSIESKSYWQDDVTFVDMGNGNHQASGVLYSFDRCSTCYTYFNEDFAETSRLERCYDDGTGHCEACGAVILTPGMPTGVKAVLSGRKAKVTWKAVANADSYNVYGGKTGSLALLKSGITGTSYTSANQTYGAEYQYFVEAVNEYGAGASSKLVSVTAMKAPASVAVTVSARKATVTWKKVTGATSYSVYGGKAGSLKLLKSGITTTSYKSANQTYGKTYEYYVVANNAGGSSANSATVSAIALKASASLTAASTSKGAVLTWKAVTGATGYEVLRDGKVIKKITKATTLTYTDKSAPKAGKKCTYAVRPIAKVAYSTVETSVKFIRVGAIGKVTLKNTAKKLTISWAKVTGATSYEVYYATSSKKPTASTKPTKTVTATSLTVKNPTKNKTYYVFVRPVGKNGSTKTYGDWSAVAKLKITK